MENIDAQITQITDFRYGFFIFFIVLTVYQIGWSIFKSIMIEVQTKKGMDPKEAAKRYRGPIHLLIVKHKEKQKPDFSENQQKKSENTKTFPKINNMNVYHKTTRTYER